MITEQIFHPAADTKAASPAIGAISTGHVRENLFKINDSLANKISYYHLELFVASLPFNLFYSHLILISYALHTLIHLKKTIIKPIFNLKFLALVSVFLVTIISTIYSINKPEAFNEWGKQLTILVIPLLFCLNPIDLKKYGPRLLMVFSLVCTATVIYLYSDAFITIKHYHLPLTAIFSVAFTNHNFSEPIDMHATFFSMQLMLALTFLVQVLINEKRRINWFLYFICALILTAGLVQLSSKVVCVVLFITLNITVPWFLLKGKARLRFILTSSSLSLLTIIVLLNSAAFKDRFINEFKFDMAKPKTGEIFDGRIARWDAAMELIAKKPLTGYGAGSEIGLLQESFYNKQLYDSYLNKLNVHSEYLSITLKSGLLGLLVYLATLTAGFVVAFRKRDMLFFTFMILIAFVSASENLLDVDKGITFYAFFFSFFAYSGRANLKSGMQPKIQ